ncbi:MAG TPA: chemotaxis protein CheB [Ktedonobacterales bacterium]|nr:chemotaxis protein CheB [Ktedonobacterales bacterium]
MPTGDAEHRGLLRDIVVIGASAGGIEALTTIVAHLPRDLPAALFVVVHIPSETSSFLAQILSRAGGLPAQTAQDKTPIEQGHIYVAPPDRHLLLTPDEVRVVSGPRENRHRPAIDPLFRSAAVSFGRRVVGIIVSGALNDGTAGLLAIKRAGGIAMVQDPATAVFPGMPKSALTYVSVDWSLPLTALADKVVELATGNIQELEGSVTMEEMDDEQKSEMWVETEIAGLNPQAVSQAPHYGKVSSYTCPDCHGPLWEIQDGPLLRFRCRVGHAFTAESMFEGQADNVEEALWMALNILEESEQLYTRLAGSARERQHRWMSEQFEQKLRTIKDRSAVIRRLLVSDTAEETADDKQA